MKPTEHPTPSETSTPLTDALQDAFNNDPDKPVIEAYCDMADHARAIEIQNAALRAGMREYFTALDEESSAFAKAASRGTSEIENANYYNQAKARLTAAGIHARNQTEGPAQREKEE